MLLSVFIIGSIDMSRLMRSRKEKGFSLLEYCAGAAVILVTIWGALTIMGGNIDTLLRSIGTWATTRAGEIGGSGTNQP